MVLDIVNLINKVDLMKINRSVRVSQKFTNKILKLVTQFFFYLLCNKFRKLSLQCLLFRFRQEIYDYD